MPNSVDLWRSYSEHPFRQFNALQRYMDRWMNESTDFKDGSFNPACEVSEDKEAYYFKFEVPGIPKDAIKVQIDENQLTVSAEKSQEKVNDSKRKHVSEVSYGSMLRTFALPMSVDAERATASCENGVLSLMIPKSNTTKSRHIPIKG